VSNPETQTRQAVIAGALCYGVWGLVPLVFQAIGRLGPNAWEIMGHRVLWGTIAAGVLVLLARQGGQVVRVLKTPKVLGMLALSALLIAANWTLFVWAVNSGRTLETSLGYYVTPLINMATGALLFRERVDRIGLGAMGLAVVGVVLQAFALGHLPVVSLVLAVTFGAYGIIRKRVAADAQTGLFVECLILALPAALFVGWLERNGQGHFLSNPAAAAWLVAAGPITAAPLALFAWAARRIPLSTMGFLQFLAPTISFFIGVAEGEPFTPLRAVSFGFIWIGAAVFAFGAWRKGRQVRAAAVAPVPSSVPSPVDRPQDRADVEPRRACEA
jgi:chloramphenicol-sensitive protein RarD